MIGRVSRTAWSYDRPEMLDLKSLLTLEVSSIALTSQSYSISLLTIETLFESTAQWSGVLLPSPAVKPASSSSSRIVISI